MPPLPSDSTHQSDSPQTDIHGDLTLRYAAIGLIAAGVAHDLGNPLCVTLSAIEAAQRAVQSDNLTGVKVSLPIAREAAEKMAIILASIRAATHPRAGEIATIADTIADAVTLTLHQIRLCARLDVDVPSDLRVAADGSLLVQVFLNLLTNAAQAMDRSPERNELRVRARRDNGVIAIDVADTGHGIPSDVLPRVFEPYFSTKGKGRGLGLYLAKQLATMQGGTIKVTSIEGSGATFRVLLPASDTPTDRDSGIIATP